MSYSLAELASLSGCTLQGSGDIQIHQVATTAEAGPGEITFVSQAQYLEQLADSQASAVIVKQEDAAKLDIPVLIHPDPYLAYARVAQLLNPRAASGEGVHPRAWVDETARLGEGVVIGANTTIEADVIIGDNTVIKSGVVVEQGTRLGSECWIGSNVTIAQGCQLGNRVSVQPGAVIGSEGFGYANDKGKWVRIPQIGRVVIGDDVEIGANTAIDRGAINDTVIEDGVILDNLIQIAHNVKLGKGTAIAGHSGIAGSAVIGEGCHIGGGCKIAGHLSIPAGTHIAGNTFVAGSIKKPGVYASGIPMDDMSRWRKNSVRFKQLDEMARRLKKLEKKVEGS